MSHVIQRVIHYSLVMHVVDDVIQPMHARTHTYSNSTYTRLQYITAQYMYKQAVIHTTLSNSLYQIQYITPHDTSQQYRTCIMDSDMASILIQSLCIKHLVHNNVYCTSWSCLTYIHVVFMQFLYPHFNFPQIFLLLPPFFFYCLLTITIIRMNVQTGI